MTDDRVERIKKQLHEAVPFIECGEEYGWAVYTADNPSNGTLEAQGSRTVEPVVERLIGTKRHHPQLKRPASIVTLAETPYFERSEMVSIEEKEAQFIADAPDNIRFLIEEIERLRALLADSEQ